MKHSPPPLGGSRADIAIIGIVGDTGFLQSFAWFQGAAVLSPDLYDSVLVFVEIAGCVFAVPGVRVLSSLPLGDVEDRISNFESRGTSNNGFQVSWRVLDPGYGHRTGLVLAGGSRHKDQGGERWGF